MLAKQPYLAAKQHKRQLISIRLDDKSIPAQQGTHLEPFSMLGVGDIIRHDLIVHVPGNFARGPVISAIARKSLHLTNLSIS